MARHRNFGDISYGLVVGGLATLAVFAGGGGLGSEIVAGSNITFKTGIVVAGGIAILIAIGFDALLLLAQRFLSPWRKVRPV